MFATPPPLGLQPSRIAHRLGVLEQQVDIVSGPTALTGRFETVELTSNHYQDGIQALSRSFSNWITNTRATSAHPIRQSSQSVCHRPSVRT
jgi:hypothetical protein